MTSVSIPLRGQRIKELSKSLLQKLYVEEGKTTREIAEILGCSFEAVRVKCKNLGVPLRNPGSKILDCSVSTIYKRVKQFGLKKQPGKTIIEKLYPEPEQKKIVQS